MNRVIALLLVAMLLLPVAASAGYVTLRKGSTGTEVLALQQALNSLGYAAGKEDGIYGTNTANAVKRFQKDHGLYQDGVAGPATRTAIDDALYGGGGGQIVYGPTGVTTTTTTTTTITTVTTSAVVSLFGYEYLKMKYGDVGEGVRTLQYALAELGYSVAVTGNYDAQTETAVKTFQLSNSLTKDGVAGSATLKAIEKAVSAKRSGAVTYLPGMPTKTLSYGMKGEMVRNLQQRLYALAYYFDIIDGNYGSSTVKAVKDFQSANALKVDGVAGMDTLHILFSDKAL